MASLVEQRVEGTENVIFVHGNATRVSTIVVRGPALHLLDETERVITFYLFPEATDSRSRYMMHIVW